MDESRRQRRYVGLDFNAPMTDATADQLVRDLASISPTKIVDVGCGWAELLLRLLAACPEATGVGVDHDDAHLERARVNAANRGLEARVEFVEGLDAIRVGPERPVDLIVCVGSEHVVGTRGEALAACADLLVDDGHLLLGTAFWHEEPTSELLADFGELPSLEELLAAIGAEGWRRLNLTVATIQDWDRFEFGFMRDWEEVGDAAAADAYRQKYFSRRGVLGFAYMLLRRDRS